MPEQAEQSGEDAFLRTARDNLLTAGVQNGRRAERLVFESLETDGHPLVQFVGERRGGGTAPRRASG